MDKFPNHAGFGSMRLDVSAASGGEKGNAAHFPALFVPVHFIEETQRRSLRLDSRKMDSRCAVR
jgi:hypothetical protein